MIILIGESGSGKTTILNKLVEKGYEKAINHTTRAPREGELESGEYKFITKEKFNKMWDNGELLQRAEFNNEYYGISTSSLKDNVVCISIVNSVKDIKNRAKELKLENVDIKTIYVYVAEAERIKRMKNRGDSTESIETRLVIDREKFKDAVTVADYVVENINVEEAVNKIIDLTKSKLDYKMINEELKEYIQKNIFPKYEKYYSHGMIHINNVINNMMLLANYYNLDKNMCYVIASYHDAGLNVDREKHEYESGKILENDVELKKYFTDEQIKIMKEAVEDHRGSRKERPRNFYGECVSDSDRDFDIELLAKRQIATALKNYPNLKTFEEHFERCYEYICKRINKSGNFNLWTNNPIMVERRDKFQKDYLNKEYAKSVYKKEWDKISNDGTMKKIINYYEDY